MKLNVEILFLLLLILSLNNCSLFINRDKILMEYKLLENDPLKDTYSPDKKYNEFYKKNYINISSGADFYVIRLEAPLYLTRPDGISLPNDYMMLKYGDIVFPVNDTRQDKYYFHVRTIDNHFGWIFSGSGIALKTGDDPNLYYFGNDYYLKSYKESNGDVDNSAKLVLAKNIVPMLLGNYSTEGWFYPEDYDLAEQISEYATTIVENRDTRFFAASIVYNWYFSEYMIAQNLLADCYEKLKMLDKARAIHEDLVKRYFWQSYDNCPLIGGLNSIIKLEIIYLAQLKNYKPDSDEYKDIKEKIIKNILIVGDNYNDMPALDEKWPNLTFAEWLLDILKRNVSTSLFYDIADKLAARTACDGFADMVHVYVALENYREGKREEAITFLKNYKQKSKYQSDIKLKEWLSSNKIIPDSVIYQYK